MGPRYNHYYFGDYYASNYQEGGIYASFSFQSSRYGYDPFYSHQRWRCTAMTGPGSIRWLHPSNIVAIHEAARPPRTWSAQIKIDSRPADATQNRVQVAVSLEQMTKRKDGPVRFQPVAREERKQIVQRGQEVQKSREQRRTVETTVGNPAARPPGAALEPARVPLPRSRIVAKPANKLGGNQAPPKMPQAPKFNPPDQPKGETPGRVTNPERNIPQPPPRTPETETKAAPGQNQPASRERQVQPEQPCG